MQQQLTTTLLVAILALALAQVGLSTPAPQTVTPIAVCLPQLPFAYNALEPVLSEAAVIAHHDKHHRGYTARLQTHLDVLSEQQPELFDSSYLVATGTSREECGEALSDEQVRLQDGMVEFILARLPQIADSGLRSRIRNDGGGFVNHNLFWRMLKPLSPSAVSVNEPLIGSPLRSAIDRHWHHAGGFAGFRAEFSQQALAVFGSGWTFLVANPSTMELSVLSTPNQDSPVSENLVPLLTLDVWEHGYYLDYKWARADYVMAWWTLVNWSAVDEVYGQLAQQKASSKQEL